MAELVKKEPKVVMVAGRSGEWFEFDKKWNRRLQWKGRFSHSYYGLKELFRNNRWASGTLKWLGNHRCDYQDNDKEIFWRFWVPVLSETMMRRYWHKSSDRWDEWDVFPQSSDKSSIFSVEGFKEFIEKNPGYGWDMQYMTQDIDDPHLWHHEGERGKNEMWFPIIKSDVKKVGSGRLVCVNTIGAALTEGREYELRDETDGLLQVVDDDGVLREFLPCRFK